MTVDQIERIIKIAGAICLEAPERQSKYASEATIPWDLIHRLRAELITAGFDLDAARKMMRKTKPE